MFNNKKDKEKIQILENELKELREQKTNINFLLEEAIPIIENERKRYLGDIALFYSTTFKNKLKHFIGMQMDSLSQFGRSEKDNDIIKANINAFRLIDEWMLKKTNEHLGNLQEMREMFADDKDFINNFKNTYGENKNN